MASTPQTNDELLGHLDDHLGFLVRSCDAFDAGHSGEAKRLAVSLRVLLHGTANSHSLLGQLQKLSGDFFSTAIPYDPQNILTHGGLIVTAASKTGAAYYAPLDDVPMQRWIPFAKWWDEIVFVDGQRASLSRRALVLAVANQDGGAHVDPKLSDTYARLSRRNSMGWVHQPSGVSIPNPERAAIRQIAHEALKTLAPGYEKKIKRDAELFFAGVSLVEGATAPTDVLPRNLGSL